MCKSWFDELRRLGVGESRYESVIKAVRLC